MQCKADLDEIYDNIAEGIKISSKCHRYKESKKSTKYFLNLEKMQAKKSTKQRLVVTDEKYFVKYNDINNEISSYFNSLIERTDHIDKLDHNTLLQSITLPSVKNDQKVACDNILHIER